MIHEPKRTRPSDAFNSTTILRHVLALMLQDVGIGGAKARYSGPSNNRAHCSIGRMICAPIESTAEKLNDGIISPLLFLFVGGPALVFRMIP